MLLMAAITEASAQVPAPRPTRAPRPPVAPSAPVPRPSILDREEIRELSAEAMERARGAMENARIDMSIDVNELFDRTMEINEVFDRTMEISSLSELAQLDVLDLEHLSVDVALPDHPVIPDFPELPDFQDVRVIFDDHAYGHAREALHAAEAAEFRMEALRDATDARSTRGLADSPRAPWAASDPADSIYRAAREALNRGEYRRAAELFREIGAKHPKSAYAADALYWEAFALYRIGTTAELRTALQVLNTQQAKFAQAATQADAATLATRINGTLATRGDASAIAAVERAAATKTACDKEDIAVRVEALNALGQMDPESATPILGRVLARRDECSASLRRRAIFLLGRRADASAVTLLTNAARTEPDPAVRSDAIQWLAKMPGEQPVATLEELLRTSNEEHVQRAAIRALMAHENPRARQAIRAILERKEAPEKLRAEVISSFDRESAGPEDAAYLRTLYPKLESNRLRERAISAISRVGGPENDQWILGLARNPNEPMEIRAAALSRASRSAMPISDLATLYDQLSERSLREQLLSTFARRKEPEATDKLLDIARSGTDPQLRRAAISMLTKKNDPRTTKLLLEIIDQ
jgi:HEAT repeat protein